MSKTELQTIAELFQKKIVSGEDYNQLLRDQINLGADLAIPENVLLNLTSLYLKGLIPEEVFKDALLASAKDKQSLPKKQDVVKPASAPSVVESNLDTLEQPASPLDSEKTKKIALLLIVAFTMFYFWPSSETRGKTSSYNDKDYPSISILKDVIGADSNKLKTLIKKYPKAISYGGNISKDVTVIFRDSYFYSAKLEFDGTYVAPFGHLSPAWKQLKDAGVTRKRMAKAFKKQSSRFSPVKTNVTDSINDKYEIKMGDYGFIAEYNNPIIYVCSPYESTFKQSSKRLTCYNLWTDVLPKIKL